MKRTKVAQELRKQEVVNGMNQGKSKDELADELKVHAKTIQRDLVKLQERFVTDHAGGFLEYKKAQLEVLELIENNLLQGAISTKVADSWRAIRADISKLLGLDAPTKHLTARVDAEGSPVFLRFKASTTGLTEEQLHEAFQYLASIPRVQASTQRDEGWFPKVQKVIEGETKC